MAVTRDTKDRIYEKKKKKTTNVFDTEIDAQFDSVWEQSILVSNLCPLQFDFTSILVILFFILIFFSFFSFNQYRFFYSFFFCFVFSVSASIAKKPVNFQLYSLDKIPCCAS